MLTVRNAMETGMYSDEHIVSAPEIFRTPLQYAEPMTALRMVSRALREGSSAMVDIIPDLVRHLCTSFHEENLNSLDPQRIPLVVKTAESLFDITRGYGLKADEFTSIINTYLGFIARTTMMGSNMTESFRDSVKEAQYVFTLAVCNALQCWAPLRYKSGMEPNQLLRTLKLDSLYGPLNNAFGELEKRNSNIEETRKAKGFYSMVVAAMSAFSREQSPDSEVSFDLLFAVMCPTAAQRKDSVIPNITNCNFLKQVRVLMPSKSFVGLSRYELSVYWFDFICYVLQNMLPVIKSAADADRTSHEIGVVNVQNTAIPSSLHVKKSNVIINLLRLIALVMDECNATAESPEEGLCLTSKTPRIHNFLRKNALQHIQECVDTPHTPTDHYVAKVMTAYVDMLGAMVRDQPSAILVVHFLDSQTDCEDLKFGPMLNFISEHLGQQPQGLNDPTIKNKRKPHPNTTFCSHALRLFEGLYTFTSPPVGVIMDRHHVLDVLVSLLACPSSTPDVQRATFCALAAACRQPEAACMVWRSVEELQVLRSTDGGHQGNRGNGADLGGFGGGMNGPTNMAPRNVNARGDEVVIGNDLRAELEREHREGKYPQTVGFMALIHWMTKTSRVIRRLPNVTAPSMKSYVEFALEAVRLVGNQRSEISNPNDKWLILALGCMILDTCLDDLHCGDASMDSVIFMLVDVVSKSRGMLDKEPFGSLRETALFPILTFIHHAAYYDQASKVRIAQRLAHNSEFVTALAMSVNCQNANVVFAAVQFLFVLSGSSSGTIGSMLYTLRFEEAVRHAFTEKLQARNISDPGALIHAYCLWSTPLVQGNVLMNSIKCAIVRLLIKETPNYEPSLTTLLCGYPTNNVGDLLPDSCLEIILEYIHAEDVAQNTPELHALCLEAMYALFAHEITNKPQFLKYVEGRSTRVLLEMIGMRDRLTPLQLGWLLHLIAVEVNSGTILPRFLPPLTPLIEEAFEHMRVRGQANTLPSYINEMPQVDLTGVAQYNLEAVVAKIPVNVSTQERHEIVEAFIAENERLREQHAFHVLCTGWGYAVHACCMTSPDTPPETLRMYTQSLLTILGVVASIGRALHIQSQVESATRVLMTTAQELMHALTIGKDSGLTVRTNTEAVHLAEGLCSCVINLRRTPSSHLHAITMFAEFVQSTVLTKSQVEVLVRSRAALLNVLTQTVVIMFDPITAEIALVALTGLITNPMLSHVFAPGMCEAAQEVPLTILVTRGLPALDKHLHVVVDALSKETTFILLAERYFGFLTSFALSDPEACRSLLATKIPFVLYKTKTIAKLSQGSFREHRQVDVDAACAVLTPIFDLYCALVQALVVDEAWGEVTVIADTVSLLMSSLQHLVHAFVSHERHEQSLTKYTLPLTDSFTRLLSYLALTPNVGPHIKDLFAPFEFDHLIERLVTMSNLWESNPHLMRIPRNIAITCAHTTQAMNDPSQYIPLPPVMVTSLKTTFKTSVEVLKSAINNAGPVSSRNSEFTTNVSILIQSIEQGLIVLFCESRENSAMRKELVKECEKVMAAIEVLGSAGGSLISSPRGGQSNTASPLQQLNFLPTILLMLKD
eukprot:PhF_6_TR44187/c1_g1_i1/m.67753